ncbi:Aminomethyltransferase [compost metagenome]
MVTSATRSPLTGKNVALCRLDIGYCEPGTAVEIGKLDSQQKRIAASVTAPIFYDPDKSRVRA